jgi:hypothetical protein
VITELTDVHWEANGLLDIERNRRVFNDRFAEINSDIAIAPGLDRWAYWAGETMVLPVRVAAGGARIPAGATLAWSVEGAGLEGRVEVPAVAPLEVGACGGVEIVLPEAGAPAMLTVRLTLSGPDGAVLAANRVKVALHPQRDPEAMSRSVASDDKATEVRLAELGHRIVAAEDAEVFVTRRLDAPRVEAIRLGQHVLLLARAEQGRERLRQDPPPREPPNIASYDAMPGVPAQPYFTFPGFGLKERNRTIWRGDWIGNFSWLRRSGP